MTFAPPTISALASYLMSQGYGNSGIVGDATHQSRPSYHNGKDAILRYGRTSVNDYSISNPRDRAGLTNAASAIDIGRGSRSAALLYASGDWFAAQCKLGNCPDVREFIWSPDGVAVRYWDGVAGVIRIGGDGTGWGDNSHRWHHHIGYFRDSEFRDKITQWSGFFADTPPAPVSEEKMDVFVVAEDWTLKDGVDRPTRSRPIRSLSEGTMWLASEPGPRTIGEYVSADGNRWRLSDRGWLLRDDLVPAVPGGDLALRTQFADFLARRPAAVSAELQLWRDFKVAAGKVGL